ncbi:putative sterigmatocystin biosynthesis polyketide synthase [Glarea lozoyensis 74030]|uniref:Putative sterigmatocystin biosynthesis polyketide synthase n=1 Tax=Glarea lozoyensis (strain ATCC 74030 / MF5533) TaxID=1104152 RepID=H0EC86_GLAL7|nr:putative sterigmatocystin biosynthesis polyketide synthase [Glarea lozoyensis 74030]
MSGRFPEAQSPEAFWDILYKGLDVCKKVPLKRWNVDTHVDPSGKAHNKGATPWGCWLDFAGEFDPRFFSISPKEAPQMDPAQRMALMATFEAMESAGMVPGTTPSTQLDRVGVFHGVTSNDWMETNTAQDIDTYFITGGNLAGGTNMIFTPDGHAGLDKGFFLSRTGNCKAFDDTADGYCRAEGVGTVFIKRLSDALADKDPILGVILDIKTNHSALSESMTRPHVGAQIDNMNHVLNTASVDPKSLSYIEMHGTGTQVGDAVEMESVLSVFAPNEAFRGMDYPLWVGSAKANIGHGEGVSGVTSLAKVLLMMKHDIIPPHCGIKPGNKINRTFPDLGARNVHIAMKPTPWKRAGLQAAIMEGHGTTRSKTKPGLLFAFTGQGSQYMGMGGTLYESFPRFRASLHRFDQLSQSLGFDSFIHVFQSKAGDIDQFPPVVVQLAICSLEMALGELLKSFGLEPTLVVGHSLGEYAALNRAGVLSVSDTLFLVGKRAELLQSRCNRGTHAMLAVKAPSSSFSGILGDKRYDIACINGPEDTVLSGLNDQIELIRAALSSKGIKSTLLKVPFAFHSAQVDPILESFIEIASSITFHKPRIPILCPLTGEVIDKADIITPSYLAKHCRETVNIAAALRYALASKLINQGTITIEVGPQPTVCGMVTKRKAVGLLTDCKQNAGLENMVEAPKAKIEVEYPETTNVHKLIEEIMEPLGGTLVFETDMSRADTQSVAAGHAVNNIALCTPSVYADIAFVLGKYLMNRLRPGYPGIIDVADLVAEKALVPHGKGPQFLRTKFSVAWAPKSAGATKSAECEFWSANASGKLTIKHAWCTIRFEDTTQLDSLKARLPEFKSKISRLRDGSRKGEFVKYNRTAGYKLMSTVATFHPDYKLLNHLVLDEPTLEACSKLNFSTVKPGGTFAAHPATDLETHVFVNHGWHSFQIYEELKNDRDYEVYVQMKHDKGDLYHGDTIVLDGDTIVAFFTGVSLRCVPRKALRMVLQQTVDKASRELAKTGAVSANSTTSVNPLKSAPRAVSKIIAKSKPQIVSGTALAHTTINMSGVAAPSALTSPPTPVAIPPKKQELSPQFVNALAIIAEESGIAVTDLTDESNFADIGVDSLLSMVIGSRFREELNLELDADFSIFVDLPTVKDLKIFLQADESGIAVSDLSDDSNFADIGVDSLLSMVIGSRFREELGLELDADFSIFVDLPTVAHLKSFLSGNSSDSDLSEFESSGVISLDESSESEPEDLLVKETQPTRSDYCKPTSSVILQGMPKTATKTLFLLPDGSGSASSYVSVPKLKGNYAIVGLNCPYARDPENMNCTHTALISSFVNEIRRRQQNGPYYLGGWSSGGAFAFVCAEMLVAQGEEVHGLVIIDAPVPTIMEQLPTSFYEYTATLGLFGQTAPPPYLIPHFRASVDVMMTYKPQVLITERMPKL